MEKILDYDLYNEAMKKTMFDKIWFLDKIPSTITTIVDFGCADGSLIKFIDSLFPNRFHFVGIDNDAEMLERAKKNLNSDEKKHYTLLNSLNEFTCYDTKNAILVLNSVVHEIFSYCSYIDKMEILNTINRLGFGYIAIRDMHYIADTIDTLIISAMKEVFLSKETEHYRQWENLNYHSDVKNTVIEFFLKYRYKTNWDREVNERYLWDWYCEFVNKLTRYKIEFKQDFCIPFIYTRFQEDFDFKIPKFNTHKKVLFKCR